MNIDILESTTVEYESYYIHVCVGYDTTMSKYTPRTRIDVYESRVNVTDRTVDPIVSQHHTAADVDVAVCVQDCCMDVKQELDQRLNDKESMKDCLTDGVESVFPNAEYSEQE